MIPSIPDDLYHVLGVFISGITSASLEIYITIIYETNNSTFEEVFAQCPLADIPQHNNARKIAGKGLRGC